MKQEVFFCNLIFIFLQESFFRHILTLDPDVTGQIKIYLVISTIAIKVCFQINIDSLYAIIVVHETSGFCSPTPYNVKTLLIIFLIT